ncbi:TGACG-sequence-specific DNA-binding protein TGA-1B [Phytophthora cinnamomi]|uniref:TGACG-sequence-specific DNA-binding protein TGA-1B n=1 Tax=Phytophthora cinnamomi TaxID=4785 RepID=UPI00355A8C47|nr:TGACG-sequence-specific DNA-binding protein TGA-1B [Phytophthora cinnamomi]
MAMDLTAEDDDLLSYFLAADVAAEQLPQTRADAPAVSAAAEQFTLGQTVPLAPERTFGSELATPASSGGQAAPAFQQAQSSFASESSLLRPSASNDDDASSATGALDSDEKRQRRLARNRESARQSRRRKKQYLELLEEKVSQLTESIDATRASHLECADEALNQVRSDILKNLAEDMKNGGSEETVQEKIRQGIMLIQERFGPNSVERIAVKDYNFRQLDNLLLPPYCRFLLWLSIQDESFFEEANGVSKNGAGDGPEKKKTPVMVKKDTLWSTLTSDLALTYEQDEKLKSLYKSGDSKSNKSERRRVAMAVTYLSKLKKSLEQRSEAVQRQTEMLHSILTPQQSLTYLRWVDANQDRLPNYVDKTQSVPHTAASDAVRAILKKDDRDLTVEDVTALLGEL